MIWLIIFIIVESTRTHFGKDKPLFYQDNLLRYEKFSKKIIHVIDRDLNPNPRHDLNKKWKDDVWLNENHQRKTIDAGIRQLDLKDEDLIIVSDADEIPDPRILQELRKSDIKIDYVGLYQDFYYYNLTYKNPSEKWIYAKIMSFKYYVEALERNPQLCRDITAKRYIQPAGWHLSYFGDSKFIKNKIKQFAHQEFNQVKFTNEDNINKCIKTGADLFNRSLVNCIYIQLTENKYLPPNHEFFNYLLE
jgi:beta-1,4-mannosyl-glycoprotein beta-1,4-N-acetylglucosaminyltransferase